MRRILRFRHNGQRDLRQSSRKLIAKEDSVAKSLPKVVPHTQEHERCSLKLTEFLLEGERLRTEANSVQEGPAHRWSLLREVGII